MSIDDSSAQLRGLYEQDGNDFSEQLDRERARAIIRELLWRRAGLEPPPLDSWGALDNVSALPPTDAAGNSG